MRDVSIRLWNREKDYPVISSWWESFAYEAVPAHILPDHGYISYNGAVDIAAGFVYFAENAPLAYAGWYIVNPEASAKERYLGINEVYSAIEEISIAKKYEIITSVTGSMPLIKTMTKNHGYEIAEHKTMHLVKKLFNSDQTQNMDFFRDQEAIEEHSEQEKWKLKNSDQLSEKQRELQKITDKDAY